MKKTRLRQPDESPADEAELSSEEEALELERHRKTPTMGSPSKRTLSNKDSLVLDSNETNSENTNTTTTKALTTAPTTTTVASTTTVAVSTHNKPSGFKMLNADQPFANATRSLYLGNLPEDCTIRDICDVVRGDRGLESVRLLPEKSCAFVDFCTRLGAERFVSRCRRQRLQIAGKDCRLGWAKERPLLPAIEKAMDAGATRNVYFSFANSNNSHSGDEDPFILKFASFCRENFTSPVDAAVYFSPSPSASSTPNEIVSLDDPLVSFLFSLFDPFGPVDMIKVVPARKIAFIHMAAVGEAMRAVAELSIAPEFSGKRLSFGRDRCGEREGHPSQPSHLGNSQQSTSTSYYPSQPVPSHLAPSHSGHLAPSPSALPNRTVFLGSVGPEVSIEDICDHIHTGQLQSIRLNPEKRCAFITFLSPAAAESFLSRSLQFGLHIRNSQPKPAFAKERTGSESSTALPAAIQAALRKGVTRCLFLGNVDFAGLSESALRAEMSHYGPLDRIQVIKDRGLAFIHFANLLDAGRAFEGIKTDSNYRNCRVGFGRDRCEGSSSGASGTIGIGIGSLYPLLPMPGHPAYYPPPLLYDPASACYYYPPPPPVVAPSENFVDPEAAANQEQEQEQKESNKTDV